MFYEFLLEKVDLFGGQEVVLLDILVVLVVVWLSWLLLVVVGGGMWWLFRRPARNEPFREYKKLRPMNPIEKSQEREKRISQMRETLRNLRGDLKTNSSYEESAQVISNFCKSGVMSVDDTIRGPGMTALWDLHSYCEDVMIGGADVRITVQMNLFTGIIMNLGNKKQQEWMREEFSKGALGAFFLTEKHAGVLSGLIVQTTATYKNGKFIMNSPNPEESQKNWISQGLTAKWGVVIARLILDDVDKGPHGFIVDMKNTPGINIKDMEKKTDFNTLDNVSCTFDNVSLPETALLSGISYIENGEYKLRDPNVPFKFVSVAQRLMSGRICIAGVAISKLERVINEVRSLASARLLPSGKDETTPLSEMPFLKDALDEHQAMCDFFRRYVIHLEKEFMTVPQIDDKLVHKIACAKAVIVNFAIDSVEEIKKIAGSLALFQDGPFGTKPDILYILRFAEGDSAILQQKMVRDELKKLGGLGGVCLSFLSLPFILLNNKHGQGVLRAQLKVECARLALEMALTPTKLRIQKWLGSHRAVTSVAKKISALTILDVVCDDVKNASNTYEFAIFRDFYLAKHC